MHKHTATTWRSSRTCPPWACPLPRGMTHDGIGAYLADEVIKAEGSTEDVVELLRDTKTDVVINYLPVGSEEATKWYVEQILQAGCAMVNCMPVFIAREAYWQDRFEKAGTPIVGDDIKSQVGATIVHRVLTRLFRERGVKLKRTYQLNVGRQLRLQEHAGADAIGVKEGVEDQRRHQPVGLRHRRGQRPYRSQ